MIMKCIKSKQNSHTSGTRNRNVATKQTDNKQTGNNITVYYRRYSSSATIGLGKIRREFYYLSNEYLFTSIAFTNWKIWLPDDSVQGCGIFSNS